MNDSPDDLPVVGIAPEAKHLRGGSKEAAANAKAADAAGTLLPGQVVRNSDGSRVIVVTSNSSHTSVHAYPQNRGHIVTAPTSTYKKDT